MPTTLTVADFLSLRMQYKAEQAENEIPAVIEHNFKDGKFLTQSIQSDKKFLHLAGIQS